MDDQNGPILNALLDFIKESPWSPLVVLAATVVGACLGAAAYNGGWLG